MSTPTPGRDRTTDGTTDRTTDRASDPQDLRDRDAYTRLRADERATQERTTADERLHDDRVREDERLQDDRVREDERLRDGAVRDDPDHDRNLDRTAEPVAPVAEPATEIARDRQSVVAREKEAFGGIKIGSAFFGWLAATGMAVILTALLAGAGTALGVATNTDPQQAVNQASDNVATLGIGGAVALLVIVFAAYYCGGYVAGRMARFNGAKQGVAVWLWTVLVALLVAGVGAAVGSQYDVLGRLNAFPRIPVGEGSMTTAGIVSILLAAVVALVGAVVGGLAGMRFHRKVDKAGLGH